MFKFITLFLSLLISFTTILISQNLKIDFKKVLEITDSEKSFLIGALDGIATDKNNNIYLFDNIQNSVIKLNDKWTFSGQINGNNWNLKPFKEIDIEDYRQNRVKYRDKGKNESSSSGPDKRVAGYINVRSVGLFENSNKEILNFLVIEKSHNKSFYHELYVEVYSQDLKFLDSQMIFSGKDDELIRKVYWKDESDNFFLATQPSRYSGKVIKFKLGINR